MGKTTSLVVTKKTKNNPVITRPQVVTKEAMKETFVLSVGSIVIMLSVMSTYSWHFQNRPGVTRVASAQLIEVKSTLEN